MQTFEQRNIWRHSTIIFFFFLLKRHWSKRETVKGGKGKSIKKKRWETFCEARFHSDYKHLIYFSWHLLSRYMVAYVAVPHIFPPGQFCLQSQCCEFITEASFGLLYAIGTVFSQMAHLPCQMSDFYSVLITTAYANFILYIIKILPLRNKSFIFRLLL